MNTANLIDRRNSIDAATVMMATVSNACHNVCRKSTVDAIDALIAQLAAERKDVANEISRRIHRFDGVPVLQARIAYGAKSAKVACAKPSDSCDEPSISLTAYNALLRRLGVPEGETPRSMEAFPVVVLGRSGQTVAAIAPTSNAQM